MQCITHAWDAVRRTLRAISVSGLGVTQSGIRVGIVYHNVFLTLAGLGEESVNANDCGIVLVGVS